MLRTAAKPLVGFVIAVALLAMTLTLQGCLGREEDCPDKVPISNGKVKMKCKGETCDEEEVECDSGYGHGVLMADAGAQMQFTINVAKQCVIKFTKEPPYCHKCVNSGNTVTADGSSTTLTLKDGARAGRACLGTMSYKCNDGKTGELANGADYDCEESMDPDPAGVIPGASSLPPCVFYVKFKENDPCSNTTKIKSAKVKSAPTKPKATEDTPTTNLAAKETPSKEKPKENALVGVDEQIISSADGHMEQAHAHAVDAHVHHAKHIHHDGETHSHHHQRGTEEDDDLPQLDHVRPWVLDAHSAAHREQQ